MTPQQVLPAYELPCDRCGQPAHTVEIYPRGRRIIHADRRIRPCDLPPTVTDTHTVRTP